MTDPLIFPTWEYRIGDRFFDGKVLILPMKFMVDLEFIPVCKNHTM